jgi:HD-GYP domain-containing protein (c-di-GMP phosphodiesterase class II)
VAIELLEEVVDRVVVGVALPFDVHDEADKLLLARGRVVTGESQRALLLARGLYVVFDAPEPDDEDPNRRYTLFERWARMGRRLERLLSTIGKVGFGERCAAFAEQLVALVRRDPDIALFAIVRQDPKQLIRWGLHHAVHCAVLAQLAATRAGWPEPRVRVLVQAALTMNLGIVEVQGLYARFGRLSEGRLERIRAHPALAVERLRAAAVLDDDWLRAVAEHHERPGGGGYPEGLGAPSEMAQALRMVDTFLARISPRVARPALPVQESVKQLFADWRSSALAAAIIKEFGVLPPGQAVTLASGEVAIVVRRGATALTPLVAAVTNARGKPVVTTTLRDTAQAGYAIRGASPDEKLVQRIPPERLYGLVE